MKARIRKEMKFEHKDETEHVQMHVQLEEILARNVSSISHSWRVRQAAKLLGLEWQRLSNHHKYASLGQNGACTRVELESNGSSSRSIAAPSCSDVDNETEKDAQNNKVANITAEC